MIMYPLAKDRSIEDMSAIGKNLGLAGVMQAGGAHDARLFNLPNIVKNDTPIDYKAPTSQVQDKYGLVSPKKFGT